MSLGYAMESGRRIFGIADVLEIADFDFGIADVLEIAESDLETADVFEIADFDFELANVFQIVASDFWNIFASCTPLRFSAKSRF